MLVASKPSSWLRSSSIVRRTLLSPPTGPRPPRQVPQPSHVLCPVVSWLFRRCMSAFIWALRREIFCWSPHSVSSPPCGHDPSRRLLLRGFARAAGRRPRLASRAPPPARRTPQALLAAARRGRGHSPSPPPREPPPGSPSCRAARASPPRAGSLTARPRQSAGCPRGPSSSPPPSDRRGPEAAQRPSAGGGGGGGGRHSSRRGGTGPGAAGPAQPPGPLFRAVPSLTR